MVTTTLFRPVGPGQLQAVLECDCRRFPARRPNQKFFYPLLHECFARRIAWQWHVLRSGVGYITAFEVITDYLQTLPVFTLGGPEHREYRIPAAQLEAFNDQIVGRIHVVGVVLAGQGQPLSRPHCGGLFQRAG
ncbi:MULTISPECIES: hypothetical protein [unclassified Ketobacter]|uniref:hypothetical protein n=1 Tax=unclassified Ketobacter TaxID=2639109 RepID=UPI0025B8CF98|nr:MULTISPECIES: hypothetical protein [unclassified Ketobacter]